jgi:hypothetical protein
MQYKPILDAMEAIIKADGTANGLIEVYRTYEVEQGVYKTPVCVIGATTDMSHDMSFLGATGGSRPRIWGVKITILILGRSYKMQAQLKAEAEKLDATQAAVYTVLNVDTKITNTVTLSWIDNIRGITLPGGEYFGHAIEVSIEKQE